MDDGFTDTPDLRMYWQRHGRTDAPATPLLLIHGGGMTIEQNWGAALPGLSAARSVIAVEEEGHGRTRPTERELTAEASASDIVAVLEDLGLDRVDVLAFSAGCQTALALALEHPHRVGRLVLCSAPWRRDALVDGFWEGLAAGTAETMPDEFRVEYLRLNPGDEDRFRRFFELDSQRMLRFRDWPDEAVAGIRSPALVVAADRDVVSVESAGRLARTLPHARLLIVPGGHGDYLGDPSAAGDPGPLERTLPHLLAFLDA